MVLFSLGIEIDACGETAVGGRLAGGNCEDVEVKKVKVQA